MKQLKELPEHVGDTLGLCVRLDDCFANGFSRLTPEQRDCLSELAATFAGTPMGDSLTESVERLLRSEFMPASFLAVAAARASLLGAVHDALNHQLCEVFEMETPASEEASGGNPVGDCATVLSATQQWLVEIAVTGFRNLEESQLTPFAATLEQIQAVEELTGLSALLTGMLEEWITKRADHIPVTRWADFWTTAMLGARELPAAESFVEIKGEFIPFGVDLRVHNHFVAVSIHGVVDERAVRLSFSSYKVGAVAGDEVWKLFRPDVDVFLQALESGKSVQIGKGELGPHGDLRVIGKTKIGKAADPFVASWKTAFGPGPATQRHPIHLSQLVRLKDCKVVDGKVEFDGSPFQIALDRLPGEEELPPKVLNAAVSMIALARFDGGKWRFQPLAVADKKGNTRSVGDEILKRLKKLKVNSLEILQERASKLLRA